jgi:threonine dehydratase
MPRTTSGTAPRSSCHPTRRRSKADGIRALGAEVTVVDGYYDEALDASRARAKGERRAGVARVRPTRDRRRQQARSAPSWPKQVPNADTVLVAIGGGGI